MGGTTPIVVRGYCTTESDELCIAHGALSNIRLIHNQLQIVERVILIAAAEWVDMIDGAVIGR